MTTSITRREFKQFAKATRRALKLQAREYERRLIKLNGEHETNIQNWLSSVRKDSFDEYKKMTDAKIDRLQQKEDQRAGRAAALRAMAAAGTLSLLVQLLQLLGWIRV